MTKIDSFRWFAAVGTSLSPSASALAEALRRRFPAFSSLDIERVADGQAALRVLRAVDAERYWWDVEEAALGQLWERAAERLGEDALTDRIARANARAHAQLETLSLPERVACHALLLEPAKEAALLVTHQAALVQAAGDGEHWLQDKFALFAAGHWVLGGQSGRIWLF